MLIVFTNHANIHTSLSKWKYTWKIIVSKPNKYFRILLQSKLFLYLCTIPILIWVLPETNGKMTRLAENGTNADEQMVIKNNSKIVKKFFDGQVRNKNWIFTKLLNHLCKLFNKNKFTFIQGTWTNFEYFLLKKQTLSQMNK